MMHRIWRCFLSVLYSACLHILFKYPSRIYLVFCLIKMIPFNFMDEDRHYNRHLIRVSFIELFFLEYDFFSMPLPAFVMGFMYLQKSWDHPLRWCVFRHLLLLMIPLLQEYVAKPILAYYMFQ